MPYVNNMKNALDELLSYVNSLKESFSYKEDDTQVFTEVVPILYDKVVKIYNECEKRGRF